MYIPWRSFNEVPNASLRLTMPKLRHCNALCVTKDQRANTRKCIGQFFPSFFPSSPLLLLSFPLDLGLMSSRFGRRVSAIVSLMTANSTQLPLWLDKMDDVDVANRTGHADGQQKRHANRRKLLEFVVAFRAEEKRWKSASRIKFFAFFVLVFGSWKAVKRKRKNRESPFYRSDSGNKSGSWSTCSTEPNQTDAK